jgi:hypothetical protein
MRHPKTMVMITGLHGHGTRDFPAKAKNCLLKQEVMHPALDLTLHYSLIGKIYKILNRTFIRTKEIPSFGFSRAAP